MLESRPAVYSDIDMNGSQSHSPIIELIVGLCAARSESI